MWKKIASLAAMLSASLTVSGCETAAYKPIICEPGTALKDGRCQRVAKNTPKTVPGILLAKKKRPAVAPIAPRPIVTPAKPQQSPFLGRPSEY